VYGGLTVERLRGRRELDVRRREDIKAGMLAINEHAAAALRICADLDATAHWPALYGEDWPTLRAKQLPGHAAEMLIALSRVELFLPDTSVIEQRVDEYFEILVAPDEDGTEPENRRLARAAAAHTALKHAIREELERAMATPSWYASARQTLTRPGWRPRVSSFLGRRD